jgi:hypothetical protein
MASKHNMALVQATRFAAAVEGNDIKSAKRLLKRGADVNTRCPDPRDLQTLVCAVACCVFRTL